MAVFHCIAAVEQQAPDVGHIEEVRTSCEAATAVSDCKPVTEADKACSADSSNSTSSEAATLQQNSAILADSSVNSDAVIASCSEKPQSSAVATDDVSETAAPASDEKLVEANADADDENPELTL